MKKLFLIGLLIRFLVMPFTGHWDIRGINFGVYNLPYKGELNVYQVAEKEPVDYIVDVNFGREYFIYPPLNYFTLGAFMTVLKPFYGEEFATWIEGYGNNLEAVTTHPHVFRYLFLMKLPYLFFDILMLVLLQKFFTKKKDQERVIKYWWLNPIVIYLPYIWGQFDIIPAFFVMWGIYKFRETKPVLGALLLGIGAAYKNYPLMFLPLVAVLASRDWKVSAKVMVAGLLPFIVTTIPYWGQEFFRKTVLFSWQSQKMLDFMWGIGGDDGIYPFVIGYILIFLFALTRLRGKTHLLQAPIIATLLWYYATTNFHTQWVLWIIPFLVTQAVTNETIRKLGLWLYFVFFFRVLVIQADITTELFVWVSTLFTDLPKTRVVMGALYDINKLRNIVNSLVVATALYIASDVLKKDQNAKH